MVLCKRITAAVKAASNINTLGVSFKNIPVIAPTIKNIILYLPNMTERYPLWAMVSKDKPMITNDKLSTCLAKLTIKGDITENRAAMIPKGLLTLKKAIPTTVITDTISKKPIFKLLILLLIVSNNCPTLSSIVTSKFSKSTVTVSCKL